jgi:hypothetical protein
MSNQDKLLKGPEAKVTISSVEAAERPLKKYKCAGALGCTGTHPPWMRTSPRGECSWTQGRIRSLEDQAVGCK